MKIILSLFLLFQALTSFASDPWNTYQWNKKNVIAANGVIDSSPWYEWWYYKVVIPETGKSYFFVYGVVNPWDHDYLLKGTRSYVGMGDFSQKIQVESLHGLADFNASYESTDIQVKNNIATDRFFSGSLTDNGHQFSWDINIQKNWSHNAEGWMMGTLITDIEWYPAQASAKCTGTVTSAGEEISFKDAPCYQDRNWGKTFPDWWTWIVSNHFENEPESALVIGGGKPRVRGTRTPVASVSIGLKHKGVVYSFIPVNMQYVQTDVSFGKWEVMAISSKYKIEISANAPKESFMDLQFVTPTGEVFHDYETLTGKLTVDLYEREGFFFKKIAHLTSNYAGIEFGSSGEFKELLKSKAALNGQTMIGLLE